MEIPVSQYLRYDRIVQVSRLKISQNLPRVVIHLRFLPFSFSISISLVIAFILNEGRKVLVNAMGGFNPSRFKKRIALDVCMYLPRYTNKR